MSCARYSFRKSGKRNITFNGNTSNSTPLNKFKKVETRSCQKDTRSNEKMQVSIRKDKFYNNNEEKLQIIKTRKSVRISEDTVINKSSGTTIRRQSTPYYLRRQVDKEGHTPDSDISFNFNVSNVAKVPRKGNADMSLLTANNISHSKNSSVSLLVNDCKKPSILYETNKSLKDIAENSDLNISEGNLLDILSKSLNEEPQSNKSLNLSFTHNNKLSGNVKMTIEYFENKKNETLPKDKIEIIDLTKTDKKTNTRKRKSSQDSSNETRKRKRWSNSSDLDPTEIFNGSLLDNLETETEERRQTFQLEKSVTDLSILKKLENQQMNPTRKFSKVTLRNKKYDTSTSLHESNRNISTSFSTSTPFVRNQTPKSLLDTKKKFVSKVKIPNFARIHQKAYEQMEDIQDYQQRKEERAKFLFSGTKPLNFSTKKKSTNTKKQLQFDVSTDEQEKPGFIPLPSTPFPKKKSKTPLIKEQALKYTDKSPFKLNCPFKFTVTENKENFEKFGKIALRTGYNRFGFKPTKTEEIKAIATKSKVIKNRREDHRSLIKGVRSNRRFDLLMKMRNK